MAVLHKWLAKLEINFDRRTVNKAAERDPWPRQMSLSKHLDDCRSTEPKFEYFAPNWWSSAHIIIGFDKMLMLLPNDVEIDASALSILKPVWYQSIFFIYLLCTCCIIIPRSTRSTWSWSGRSARWKRSARPARYTWSTWCARQSRGTGLLWIL